jgi:hypothetical protein
MCTPLPAGTLNPFFEASVVTSTAPSLTQTQRSFDFPASRPYAVKNSVPRTAATAVGVRTRNCWPRTRFVTLAKTLPHDSEISVSGERGAGSFRTSRLDSRSLSREPSAVSTTAVAPAAVATASPSAKAAPVVPKRPPSFDWIVTSPDTYASRAGGAAAAAARGAAKDASARREARVTRRV